MLLVPTRLAPSPIHGFGVFLLAAVPAGTPVWRYDPRIDRTFTLAELAALPEHVQTHVRTYSTWHEPEGVWLFRGDDGRFVNHSDTPNTHPVGEGLREERALGDLAPGDELTADYRAICDEVRLRGAAYLPGAAPKAPP